MLEFLVVYNNEESLSYYCNSTQDVLLFIVLIHDAIKWDMVQVIDRQLGHIIYYGDFDSLHRWVNSDAFEKTLAEITTN